MNATRKSEFGCWKIGCIGCGGLAILSVVTVLAVFGIAKRQVAKEQVEDQRVTHDFRESDRQDHDSSADGPGTEGSLGSPSKIRLDLAHANFEIEPARPDEPMTLEARFDVNSYELTRDETDSGELVIVFRRQGSGWIAGIKEMLGGTRPKVKIYLPRDTLLELELRLAQGGAEVDLGGLQLQRAKIQFEQGGLDLDFSEPLAAPMERLEIDGSMGGVIVADVGNASPKELEVLCSMGGMQLDLRGPWVNDSDIRIDARMGGAAVRLPRGTRIEGLPSSKIRLEDQAELEAPLLRFHVSESMGEVEILP